MGTHFLGLDDDHDPAGLRFGYGRGMSAEAM